MGPRRCRPRPDPPAGAAAGGHALTGDAELSRGERDLRDIDAVFHALAHPTRRHLLQVLQARGGAMTSGQLAARFSHAWPTVTRHLRELEAAGLVRARPVGRERHYELDVDRLTGVTTLWLSAFTSG